MKPTFKHGIWFADFEFHAKDRVDGNTVHPICLVASELQSGKVMRVWQDELREMPGAPFPVDEKALFVAYMASAEMACFRALRWPVPANVLDLYAEFRNHTNGKHLPAGAGLVGALTYFGEPCMGALAKDAMRQLVLSGGPWSQAQQQQILDYCVSDVTALQQLFLRMGGLSHV